MVAPLGTMKIMCLNCRGLVWPEAVQEVRSLIQLHRPLVVFLSEMRVFSNNVENLRSLGFLKWIGVGSFRRGGGLALLWMHDVCVKLQSYDKLHKDVAMVDPTSNVVMWRFTGFYREAR